MESNRGRKKLETDSLQLVRCLAHHMQQRVNHSILPSFHSPCRREVPRPELQVQVLRVGSDPKVRETTLGSAGNATTSSSSFNFRSEQRPLSMQTSFDHLFSSSCLHCTARSSLVQAGCLLLVGAGFASALCPGSVPPLERILCNTTNPGPIKFALWKLRKESEGTGPEYKSLKKTRQLSSFANFFTFHSHQLIRI